LSGEGPCWPPSPPEPPARSCREARGHRGSYTTPVGTIIRVLSDALEVPVTMLVQDDGASMTSTESERSVQTIKKKLAGYDSKRDVNFEPYLIKISDKRDNFSIFPQAGYVFIYLMEGKMNYVHGHTTTEMSPGDHILFSENSQHGPSRLITLPLKMLYVRVHSN
jgi:hypothetical protein